MCRANKKPSTGSGAITSLFSKTFKQLWPVPLPFVACLFFVIFPPQSHLFGGYTRWFARLSFVYLLTQNNTLCKFLAVQGLAVNVGCYTVAAYDFIVEGGAFGNILYRNSPGIRSYTLKEGTWGAEHLQLVETPTATFLLFLCHVVDILIHIIPLYYFVRRCKKAGYSMDQIASWPILGGAFLLSRFWSITRCWHHHEKFGLFYYGSDVYWLPPNSDYIWHTAYTAETLTFMSIAAWKIWKRRGRQALKEV
jgi:hypothetical protein